MCPLDPLVQGMADPQGAGSIGLCVVRRHARTHSLSRYLLSIRGVPGTMLGAGDTAGNKAKSLSS